jgi:hypothetical protein
MKDLTHDEVDLLLSELEPPPEPWHGLLLHQKVGLLLGIAYPRFAWWYDLGTGKTLLTLEVLQYWWMVKRLRRALIFVKSDKAFPTWERQIAHYGITVPYITLDADSSAGKWTQLETFGDGIVLMHYPGAVAQVCERVKKDKGYEWELNDKLVEAMGKRVDAIVLDESVKVANHQSLTYRLVKKLAKRTRYLYALSGMPFGRDPTLLWTQCNLVDGGETLGPTLGLFRAAFFNEQQNYASRSEYAKEYSFNRNMEPTLARVLQHRSLTYTAAECIDLPPVVPLYEEVHLPSANRGYYDAVVNEIIEAKGNQRAMKNAFIRMRQLSSGFLGLKDDETGEKVQIDFEENPKLDRLLDVLEELPEGRKAVVFYEFTHSGAKIYNYVQSVLKYGAIWLWSGTTDSRAELDRFMYDKDCQVAVVQHRVGAYSLDELKVANYTWFYESPVSAMDRVQAERRTLRQGQKEATVFMGDLVVKGTVDEAILGFHKEGKDLFKALLANPGILFKSLQRMY